MKLDKLKTLSDELKDETSLDDFHLSIYYYFDGNWNELNNESIVPENIVSSLNGAKKQPGYYAAENDYLLFCCDKIDCIILLKSKVESDAPISKEPELIINKIERRALNEYKVTYNPMTQLLAKDAFKNKLREAIHEIAHVEPNSQCDIQSNIQDDSQIDTNGKLLAVLALDIDHFKQINDTCGHIYGDQVLKTFALRLEKCAKKIINKNEIKINLSHPSGEEFWILIYGTTSKEKIIEWANDFRTEICNTPLPSEEEWYNLGKIEDLDKIVPPLLHERNVSASIGVYFYTTSQATSDKITEILEDADTALYRAKASGRNQVIPFEDILNKFGRVIEHDEINNVIALDIGKNVGVSKGQEFKVYSPNYTGRKNFVINDGRTTRIIGNYPRIELTTITVFDVQAELSFAFVTDEVKNLKIETGSVLEAIPTGSFGHLLSNVPRHLSNLPGQSSLLNVTDLERLIKDEVASNKSIFSIVFRFSSGIDYLKKYGSASLNGSLARLFSELGAVYQQTSRLGIIDSSAICVIGKREDLNKELLNKLSESLKHEFNELNLRVGVYIDTDTKNNDSGINNRLDASNAIELSRFATSDYASDNKSDVIYFSHLIAVRIVNTQRLKNKLPQALADFEKFRQLGVESAQLFNQAGVISSSLGNDKAAAEFYENAVKMDNNTIVYKSNLCSVSYRINNYERALEIMSSLTDNELDNLRKDHEYGYVNYARTLAKAKMIGLSNFNAERFRNMAENISSMEKFKDSQALKDINSALNMC
jgi:diguanylate cyclase (GGDEF)-like protein